MSPLMIAAALVLGFAISINAYSVNDVGIRWRHQFQYFMKDNSAEAKAHVINYLYHKLDVFQEKYPGLVESLVFGADLGIGSQLYPNVTSPNADLAGRIDFRSESGYETYVKWLSNEQDYKDMVAQYVQTAVRIQYIAKTSLYSPGTYWRSSWEYTWNSSYTSDQVQNVVVNWFKWAQHTPAKVKAFAAGADLGLGLVLSGNRTNYKVGGSITFYTKEELVKFWAYLYPRADYQALIKTIDSAVRIQYQAKY